MSCRGKDAQSVEDCFALNVNMRLNTSISVLTVTRIFMKKM